MPQFVASDQGLYCFPMSPKPVIGLQTVKEASIVRNNYMYLISTNTNYGNEAGV